MRFDAAWRTAMVNAREAVGIGVEELGRAVTARAKQRCSWANIMQIEDGRCSEHWAVPHIAEQLGIPLPEIHTVEEPASPGSDDDNDDEIDFVPLHESDDDEEHDEVNGEVLYIADDEDAEHDGEQLASAPDGLVVNRGYDRPNLRVMIPGVHPQKAVTQARDEVGGLVVLVKQHTQYPYTNAFDGLRREFWMDINEADHRANERLRTMDPIRLFFWRTAPVRDVSGYRYLGRIKYARAEVRGDRLNYVFLLCEPDARVRDLPQLTSRA